jgi:hypothetical protein
LVFKGTFGPFFKFWDEMNTLMDWNDDAKMVNGKKGDVLYVYITDSDRTKNLLLNVMGIAKTPSDPS